MINAEQDIPTSLEEAYLAERDQLLRLCMRFTGDAETAQDLVQEALLEAWRHEQDLRNPTRRIQWLFGIARNVCLRWARERGRETARVDSFQNPAEVSLDDVDVELELERSELATLLDRAMSLLPPDTRRVLVERYVEDLPEADIAGRLGLSE